MTCLGDPLRAGCCMGTPGRQGANQSVPPAWIIRLKLFAWHQPLAADMSIWFLLTLHDMGCATLAPTQAWGSGVRSEVVMRLLGLAHCAGTFVGNEMVRGISGGEKKRLSTAEQVRWGAVCGVVCPSLLCSGGSPGRKVRP